MVEIDYTRAFKGVNLFLDNPYKRQPDMTEQLT
jgi:hypothetical protein